MNKKGVALTALMGGLTIFIFKLVAYVLSGSVALLSDAMESIVNIIASGLMYFSVHISSRPADERHHYGHQNIENISSLIEGLLIMAAALFIIYTAVDRIFQPIILNQMELALIVSFCATSINALLSWYLGKTAKDVGSIALEGDAKHLLSDVLTSVGVITGLVMANLTGWAILDPLIGLTMVVIIMRMGVTLIFKSSKGLMDSHVPEVESEIISILKRHRSQFIDFHDVKTRRSGNKIFAELHISVDSGLTVQEAHDFTDHLEDDLKKELSEVSIVIHIEPPEPEKVKDS